MRSLMLLLALLLFAACTPLRVRDDDDDASGDDDDSGPGDDDDATFADDDDTGADDDDTGADDDDTAVDDDDATPEPNGTSQISGTLLVNYWTTLQPSPVSHCQQAYDVTAMGTYNTNAMGADCIMCRGRVEILSVVDVTATSPAIDTAAGRVRCDPFTHFTASQDFGAILFGPQGSPSNPQGDFLHTIGLIPEDLATGNQLVVMTGGNSVADVFANPPANGVVPTHVGMYVLTDDMYFVTGSNLGDVAEDIPGTTDTAIFWFFWSVPSNEDVIGMDGEYLVTGAWNLGFNGTNPDYDALTFSGQIAGTFTPTP
jgi:hypothetical protein